MSYQFSFDKAPRHKFGVNSASRPNKQTKNLKKKMFEKKKMKYLLFLLDHNLVLWKYDNRQTQK